MGYYPGEQCREQINSCQKRYDSLAEILDAGNIAADQRKQPRYPPGHSPVTGGGDQQNRCADDQPPLPRKQFLPPSPEGLPQKEEPEMREQQRPRHWIAQLKHKGAVQSQQRQRKPVLLSDRSEGALYRGLCSRFRVHFQISALRQEFTAPAQISGCSIGKNAVC